MSLAVRPITRGDTAACIEIYLDAIHNGTAPHYSEAEREAWAPRNAPQDHADWSMRLGSGLAFLASGQDGAAGFIVLNENGYLDLFFVRPAARRDGVARALYDHALKEAHSLGLTRLTTHASYLARRFLEPRGWVVAAREVVERNGIPLERFEMVLVRGPS